MKFEQEFLETSSSRTNMLLIEFTYVAGKNVRMYVLTYHDDTVVCTIS